MKFIHFSVAALVIASVLHAAEPVNQPGPKVFIAPAGGMETYISAAIQTKHVPVTVVVDQAQADYVIEVSAESAKAGWAKILITRDVRSSEDASIRMVDAKTKVVAFAYAYHTGSSWHGKQSAAESCAKHLGEWLKKR